MTEIRRDMARSWSARRCRGGGRPCGSRAARSKASAAFGGAGSAGQGVGGGVGDGRGGARVRAGQALEVLGGAAGGPGGVAEGGGAFVAARPIRAAGPRWRGLVVAPAVAQLGEGEVGREPPAAVPDGAAAGGVVAGEPDSVAGDLVGVAAALAESDEQPGAAELVEEVGFAGGGGWAPRARGASSSSCASG